MAQQGTTSNNNIPRRALFLDDNSKQVIFSDDLLYGFDQKNLKTLEDQEPIEEQETLKPIIHENGANWLPALGYSKKFDGHTFLAGATESGKSYFIKKMIMNDKLHRQVILFTNLKTDDESFRGIEHMVKFNPNGPNNWDWVLKNSANKILIFDDIRNNEIVKHYKDKMLEEGRHINTIVICVNHRLQDWHTTKVALNDCRFIVTFPSSNRGNVKKYLKDEAGLDRKQLNQLMKIATDEGRYLIVHRFAPMALAATESIFKL